MNYFANKYIHVNVKRIKKKSAFMNQNQASLHFIWCGNYIDTDYLV